METMLEVQGLIKIYRKRRVVDGVGLHVDRGEIVGLLGPNGAGKTTTFRMTLGLIDPDAGDVKLDGKGITRLPMYKRARMGVSYLPQEPSVFQRLTVKDNILAILQTQRLSRRERMTRLWELLGELELTRLADSKAYNLSGGERRRLEITRALVLSPRYLLLDEPFAGIDPIVVSDIQKIIRTLRDRGIGVLLTDHKVRETLEVTDRSYIINEGRILVHGHASEIISNPEARRVYLGDSFHMPEIAVREGDRTRTVSSYEVGLAELRRKSYAAARAAFERAAEANEPAAGLSRALAATYLALGEFDLAWNRGREAVSLDPNQALSYVFRGLAARGRGDLGSAQSDLEEACRLDPDLVGHPVLAPDSLLRPQDLPDPVVRAGA